MSRPGLAFALALALAALYGCSEQDVRQAGDAVASAAPRLASDGLIVATVESRLLAIDADSALHVAVSSNDGVARLSGKVTSDGTRRRFLSAAAHVQGVKRVVAALSVDAAMPSTRAGVADFGLAAAVRASIAAQAGLSVLHLGVSARSGTVTLSGRVETKELRTTILRAAKQTHGARRIVDDMSVGSE